MAIDKGIINGNTFKPAVPIVKFCLGNLSIVHAHCVKMNMIQTH